MDEKPPMVVLAEIVHFLRSHKGDSVAEVLPQIEKYMAENKMVPQMVFIPVLIFGGVPKDVLMKFSCHVKFESDGTTTTMHPILEYQKNNNAELKAAKRYFPGSKYN